MPISSTFEKPRHNLDEVFAEIIENNQSQLDPDQTLASILAESVKLELNHIDNTKEQNTNNIQREKDFLKNEYNTWMLLDTIQRSTNPINTCSNIKQWISGISNYNQMDIITKKKFEEEIDDEMFSIFNNIPSLFNSFKDNGQSRKRKNVMDKEDNEMINNDSFDDTLPIHYDNETMPKVIRRRLEDQDNNDDHFYELQYIRLRNGDMDDFIRHNQFDKLPWRKALFTSYVQRYNKFQLNQNNFLEIDEQKSWQLSCKGLIHQSGLEKYGEALYGVLIGDIQHQLQVCQSWEDIIWAYYNSQIEYGLNEIANKLALSEDLSTLNNKYKEIADQKDNNLPSQHVNHFFHLIQSHILNKQLHSLFELIYLHMTDKKSLKAMDIMNDVGIHKHMHRFMATLAIYANMYFSLPKENTNSGWLIYTYAEQYQNPAIFNPTLLAIYAAKLNGDNQVELFSNFLNGFDGEKEERKILVDMGKEHHLQMKSILQSTFKKHTKEPLKEIEAMGKNSIDNSIIEEANIPSCVSSYLHGLEWLMMDEALYGDVLNEANYILRQLFGLQRINLVAVVIKFIPTDILNVCILNTNEVLGIPPYLEEFRDHCTLVDCLDLYRSWQTLHNNYPSATLRDLHTLKLQINWKNNMIELCEKLEMRFSEFLKSSWLKGKESENEKESLANDRLRSIYIPEIILRYHDVLYQTKDLWDGYSRKKEELVHLVASDQNGIYKDLVSTKKLGTIIQILNK